MKKNKSQNHLDNMVKEIVTGNAVVMIIMSLLIVFLLFGSVFAYSFGVKEGKTISKRDVSAMQLNYEAEISTYKSRIAAYENKVTSLKEDFVVNMLEEELNTNPHELTKSKLKACIASLEETVNAFSSFGLNEKNSEVYAQLNNLLTESKTALETGDYMYPYTDAEFNLCCKAVMNEQGANVSTDEAQQGVLWVIINRKNNGGIGGRLDNPTYLDILQEPGQYANKYTTDNPDISNVTEKVKENVRKVLEREVEPWPENVLFQALFPQGTGTYKKIYNPKPFDSYTYFCYGNLAK